MFRSATVGVTFRSLTSTEKVPGSCQQIADTDVDDGGGRKVRHNCKRGLFRLKSIWFNGPLLFECYDSSDRALKAAACFRRSQLKRTLSIPLTVILPTACFTTLIFSLTSPPVSLQWCELCCRQVSELTLSSASSHLVRPQNAVRTSDISEWQRCQQTLVASEGLRINNRRPQNTRQSNQPGFSFCSLFFSQKCSSC